MKIFTAVCWLIGPLGTMYLLWIWSQEEADVKLIPALLILMADLWLLVKLFAGI
jgi:hypothetical protein